MLSALCVVQSVNNLQHLSQSTEFEVRHFNTVERSGRDLTRADFFTYEQEVRTHASKEVPRLGINLSCVLHKMSVEKHVSECLNSYLGTSLFYYKFLLR